MQELRYAKDAELDPIGGKEIYRDGKQRRDDKIFILEFSFQQGIRVSGLTPDPAMAPGL